IQEAATRQLRLEDLQDFQAHPGAGVTAQTASRKILIGTRRLMEEQAIAITQPAEDAIARLDAGGQTALLVARDGVLLGVLGARDQVRQGIVGLLNELRSLGIDPIVLLTGDRAATAKAADSENVFTEIHAELLPEQKAQFITDMKARQTTGVAMVGDGINDAPALARADVGIAI